MRANAKIATHFNETYKSRIGGSLFLLEKLNEVGLMCPASFPKEYKMLAKRMINFGDTWIYTFGIYLKNSSDKYLEIQALGMLRMIYPHLTKKGKDELEKEIPNWFM